MEKPVDPNKEYPLFNPLDKDFNLTWYNDKNEPILLTIKTLDTVYYKKAQYEFMKRHLTQHIINVRDIDPWKKPNAIEDIHNEITLSTK